MDIIKAKEALEQTILKETGLKANIGIHFHTTDNSALEAPIKAAKKAFEIGNSIGETPIYWKSPNMDVGGFHIGKHIDIYTRRI